MFVYNYDDSFVCLLHLIIIVQLIASSSTAKIYDQFRCKNVVDVHFKIFFIPWKWRRTIWDFFTLIETLDDRGFLKRGMDRNFSKKYDNSGLMEIVSQVQELVMRIIIVISHPFNYLYITKGEIISYEKKMQNKS